MGPHSDKDAEKSRSKSRDAKGSVSKTDPKGSGNSDGNNAVIADANGSDASTALAEPAVVPGPSSGRKSGTVVPLARGRGPLANLGGRSSHIDHALNIGVGLADQMRAKPADQAVAMMTIMSRLERSNQLMVDMMLQQNQGRLPEIAVTNEAPIKHMAEDNGFSSDEDEFDPEADIFDHVDKNTEEEEDVDDLSTRFQGKKPRVVPDETQIFVWKQARKVGSDFVQDDWRNVSQASLVKSYNSHPEAIMFSAPLADAEVPDLKFKDKKDLEKQMKSVQSGCGASAAAATKSLAMLQEECDKLNDTAKDFRNPDVVITDSRGEMADVLDAVRHKLLSDLAKTIADAVKLNAWQFNQITMMRRAQYLFKIKVDQNARAIVKKVNPTDQYLFGDKLGQVCKNLKESGQLNPLSETRNSWSTRGSGFTRGSRGSFRGRRPGFKFGGSRFASGGSAAKKSHFSKN
eukprot:GFUD01022828.1.p1 GENE.GFUD01022828.1~~GFUD01022828.1.p1  ORF type:complete len:460 (-),score=104.28 GFUD01022828.1:158-1537(-)